MKKLEKCIEYAKKGCRVFPVKPNDKKPAIKGWQKEATTDTQQIERWWNQNPDYNIGIVADDLILDVDVNHDDGADGFKTLEKYDKLPNTFYVDTPKGGRHYYFSVSQDSELTSRVGVDLGLDIRAGGKGYVVGAGSTIDGKEYIASGEDFKVEAAPGWLFQLAKKQQPNVINSTQAEDAPLQSLNDIQKSILVALKNIDPNINYDEWVKVGMAIHSEIPDKRGLALWDKWSNSGDSYKFGECATKWASFTSDGGITLGTLKHMANTSQLDNYQPDNKPLLEQNDSVIVDKILQRHISSILYLTGTEEWCIWNGKQWVHNNDGKRQVGTWLDETIDEMAIASSDQFSSDPRKAAENIKWLATSKNQNKREAVLRYLKERTGMCNTKLDSNPNLLGVSNGVIDISTNSFRDVNKEDLITRYLGAEYQPGAKCPNWLSFLDTIMEGNNEMDEYLQRLVGYWLTTDISEQEIYFLYGEGANGKSTFLDTIKKLMGDYAVRIASESVMKNKYGTRSNASLANIAQTAGARMALTDEINDTDTKLDVGLVKSLSGDAEVHGKMLHKNPVTFKTSAKLVMYGNDKPYGDFTDAGLWRRMKLIHFGYTVPADKRDKHLLNKLQDELPGILNWALTGHDKWNTSRLKTPEKVLKDSESYRNEFDNVTTFLDTTVEYEFDQFTRSSSLRSSYESWCDENGENPRKVHTFRRGMSKYFKKKPGVETGSDGYSRGYQGVKLKDRANPEHF